MKYTFSQHIAHIFHVISNMRPLVWMGLYVVLIPIFALIYWALPDGQFRIPDGASTDYVSWLYYSIVTITTLGFGDYTPALPGAQAITAIEVMCGITFLGFFLNAVGSMKSEIDVESEIEKQKALHRALEKDKLEKSVPLLLNSLNVFLDYCFAVTTPEEKRKSTEINYNPDFTIRDLAGMFEPSGLPFDRTTLPAVERLVHSAEQSSLALDSLQQRIDLAIWPELLENCFSFVANFQMFSNTEMMFRHSEHIKLSNSDDENMPDYKQLSKKIAAWNPSEDINSDVDMRGVVELFNFIKENAQLAQEIESLLAQFALVPD